MCNVSHRLYPSVLSLLAASLTAAAGPLPVQAAVIDPQIEAKVDALLQKMTLEEKIGQMNQVNYHATEEQALNAIRTGQAGSVLNMTDFGVDADIKQINAVQRLALEHSPSGIPLLFERDVIHGFKTVFPIPLGLAATFNPELVEQGARIAAQEARASGVHITFAPMIDISRDARWGRIAESFGEDPWLVSQMGVAMIKGFQTSDLRRSDAIGATAKHFFGYGAAEGGRDYNSTHIPAGQLYNVYLPPFKAAIDSGVVSVMTSFTENDGIPATANRQAIQDILRRQLGFRGFVVSDWNATGELIEHGFAQNRKEAAEKSVNAGVDMEMFTASFVEHLPVLVSEGKVSRQTIDDRVRNILRVKFQMGLFEQPFFSEKPLKDSVLRPESLLAAQRTAEQSVVMLRNENHTLPLRNIRKLAIIGPMADKPHEQMGTWSWDGDESAVITPLAAFRQLKGLSVLYQPGLSHSRDTSTALFSSVTEAVKQADAAIVFLGEESILSGEAHSLAGLDLTGAQSQLLAEVKKVGKPVVLVIMAGRPLTIAKELPYADAVLYSFHPGTMGGPALRDLIIGKANPSGKLPLTFVQQVGQIPLYYNHNNTGRPAPSDAPLATLKSIPIGAEQTSLGNTSYYLDAGRDPLFPFGYGLSYSNFEYGSLTLSASELRAEETLTASIALTNSSQTEGCEVVQLYLRDVVSSRVRPVKELIAFKRVSLKAGETQTVSFTIQPEQLAFYNGEDRFIAEAGDFQLWAGGNSQSGKQASFRFIP